MENRCNWDGKMFHKEYKGQEYCGKACRIKHAKWKEKEKKRQCLVFRKLKKKNILVLTNLRIVNQLYRSTTVLQKEGYCFEVYDKRQKVDMKRYKIKIGNFVITRVSNDQLKIELL